MNTKIFFILGVIITVGLGAAFFSRGGVTKPSTTGGDSTGLIVGNNAIYVAEQAPSETTSIAVARLEKTGFVAIHEDNADKPGRILGTSSLLAAGETRNLPPITLSRITKDSETLYAMLRLDDGDGVFDPAKDKPALDSVSGEPVMMIFTVSVDASEPGAVNP